MGQEAAWVNGVLILGIPWNPLKLAAPLLS